MADDHDLPEWMEWPLGKLALGLIVGGGGAFVVGVVALFGGLNPDFSPLFLLVGGPAAVGVGIGLYRRQTWAILLALLPCLGLSAIIGFRVASGDVNSVTTDVKGVVFAVILLSSDFALLGLLALRVLHSRGRAAKWSAVNAKYIGRYRYEHGTFVNDLTLRADGSASNICVNTKLPLESETELFSRWDVVEGGRTLRLTRKGGGEIVICDFGDRYKKG